MSVSDCRFAFALLPPFLGVVSWSVALGTIRLERTLASLSKILKHYVTFGLTRFRGGVLTDALRLCR